jgi:hypothetical protein
MYGLSNSKKSSSSDP